MLTFEELYQKLNDEDKAFVDGYCKAVKDITDEDSAIWDGLFVPNLPKYSRINNFFGDLYSVIRAELYNELQASIRELITGTLDSYEVKND